MDINIGPSLQVNIFSNVINFDFHIDASCFSFRRNPLVFWKKQGKEDIKKYAHALSTRMMKQNYSKLSRGGYCYNRNYFPGFQLPYTIEMKFFKESEDDKEYVNFYSVKAKHESNHDFHPYIFDARDFYTPEFLDLVRAAIAKSKRRWDELKDTNQIRIGKIDKNGRVIEVGKTSYNSQVLTNLSIDLPRTPKGEDTLRSLTTRDGGPPDLDDVAGPKLANSLGIAILCFYRDEESGEFLPLVPLRDNVIIFKNEWGCSSSFAARWDDIGPSFKDEQGIQDLWKFSGTLLAKHIELELKIFQDILKIFPLALTRELFRGGKPQLFFGGVTTLTRREILMRISEAPHREEVKRSPILKYFLPDKEPYILMNSKNIRSYKPSIEYMMNASLMKDFASFNKAIKI